MLRATSLSSSETSREGSRGGLWSPLGCQPLLTAVAMCDDGQNRVSSPPVNSDTRALAGTGSELSSSAGRRGPRLRYLRAAVGGGGGDWELDRSPDTTDRVRAFPSYRLAQTATVMGKRQRLNGPGGQTIKREPLRSVNMNIISPETEARTRLQSPGWLSPVSLKREALDVWACAFFTVPTQEKQKPLHFFSPLPKTASSWGGKTKWTLTN